MVSDNPETFADLDGHQSVAPAVIPPVIVVCPSSLPCYPAKSDDPSAEQVKKLKDKEDNSKTTQPQAGQQAQTAQAASAGGALATVEKAGEAAIEEVDKVAKPLIESAADDSGALISGGSKLAGGVVGVAAAAAIMGADFLFNAPATAGVYICHSSSLGPLLLPLREEPPDLLAAAFGPIEEPRRLVPEDRTWSRPSVIGLAMGWGRVVEDEAGWHAEYARPLTVAITLHRLSRSRPTTHTSPRRPLRTASPIFRTR